jgi:hypothetical protein
MLRRPHKLIRQVAVVSIATSLSAGVGFAESMPAQLRGSWKITRILKTTNMGCWSTEQAQPLVGSTLAYDAKAMHWKGGDVPLLGITSRTVTDDDLRRDAPGNPTPLSLAELEIRGPIVTEYDLQHEDADITGASTEVPGDSVLIAGPNRIVVSACGIYFEATRATGPRKPSPAGSHH